MANDRDCKNCKHKVNGACNVWECKFEPKEDEPFEPREDAISRQAVLDEINRVAVKVFETYDDYANFYDFVAELPPVNPQKAICPSAGVDCEDCPAYEDTISRKAVFDTLERMDKALDEDRTVENYKELLRECYKVLPSVAPKPKSEWEHDHEILKAYSDGASVVLDKVRDEISERSRMHMDGDLYIKTSDCMQIIDEFTAEEDKA